MKHGAIRFHCLLLKFTGNAHYFSSQPTPELKVRGEKRKIHKSLVLLSLSDDRSLQPQTHCLQARRPSEQRRKNRNASNKGGNCLCVDCEYGGGKRCKKETQISLNLLWQKVNAQQYLVFQRHGYWTGLNKITVSFNNIVL